MVVRLWRCNAPVGFSSSQLRSPIGNLPYDPAVARVVFTANLQRHVPCPPTEVDGDTVHEALTSVFDTIPRLRGYVLDERGALRKHMAVFVDGDLIRDRVTLSDPVGPDTELYVMQALSGG